MRVHLVHAHPEPQSFVAAMRDTVVEEFRSQGAVVTVADLYAMGFDPVLSGADFSTRQNQDHLTYPLEQRHAFATGTLARELQEQVSHVLEADVLAFTFPIFWFGVPAILKGWIERVFLSGPFYGGRRVYGRGGLAGKRAVVAMSLGGRAHMFGPDAIHGELETGMMRHFFQGTLGYVGLAVHQPFVAYHVPYVDAAARSAMLGDLRSYLRSLSQQPILPVPALDDYDEVFAPKAAPK
jgi:NAD(P)H dehydrogenase (quinone)